MNHLLIVDDNAVDREMIRGLLEQRRDYHAEFASNGLEAIEHLESRTPLAVITDLQMPEMDGLELVRYIRRRYPGIPVILLTAHGSEEIALEALVDGAADYLPKHRAPHDLLRVVQSVLEISPADRRHGSITAFLRYKQLRYEVDSDVRHIPALVDQVQQAVADVGIVDFSDRLRLAKCLAEALRNAIDHGTSTAQTPSPRVYLHVEIVPEETRIRIRDEGQGFNPASLPDPRVAPERLTASAGRGLTLIRLFMDEVHFNEAGNEITLVKRRPAA